MAELTYSIRRSPKAKNIRLKVTPHDGLVVILPEHFEQDRLAPILKRKRGWIDDALARARRTKRFLEPRPISHLPEQLDLRALHERWAVEYHEVTSAAGLTLKETRRYLEFRGRDFLRERIREKLKAWLRLRLRDTLATQAMEMARSKGFRLRNVLIKNQRTRWASCSVHRNLSLNIKLLFLPPDLVSYSILHELCHTVHMNHSNAFWRLVQQHEPGFRALDSRLREAWKTVPSWLFED